MDKQTPNQAVANDSHALGQHLYDEVLKPSVVIGVAITAAALAVPAARALVRIGAETEVPELAREGVKTNLFSAVNRGIESLEEHLPDVRGIRSKRGLAKTLVTESKVLKSGNIPVQKWNGFCLLGSREEQWLRQVYDQSKNSIAHMTAEDGTPIATAFVVDREGVLATNRHVAQAVGKGDFAVFPDGRRYSTKLMISDSEADVALLRLKAKPGEQFPALPLGDPTRLPSFKAAALGYPGDYRSRLPALSPGTLRYLNYDEEAKIGLDMETFYGNSGSPILDQNGKVIGIVQCGTDLSTTTGLAVQHVKHLLAECKDLPAYSAPLRVRTSVQGPSEEKFPDPKILFQDDLVALSRDLTALQKHESEYKTRTLHRYFDDFSRTA